MNDSPSAGVGLPTIFCDCSKKKKIKFVGKFPLGINSLREKKQKRGRRRDAIKKRI